MDAGRSSAVHRPSHRSEPPRGRSRTRRRASLVLFEVYQSEVFKTGSPDLDAVDDALGWVDIVEETDQSARAAAELQATPATVGEPLAARDAYVAGTARTSTNSWR